ncbi:MAG: amino acid permease [Kiritimatiellia bacterium]|jgi:amino acid transporter/mannitol/fructose-specific phosphotransferase system IIA component (Ntr-type)|nr:amino acid permease [Kiritimatiellia bacterium]MDP6630095.1 amino acid permease [Kiritimatiellia bacterium]MDP6811254.1 amino acid permease [Kiritimatiellia bacterium]
MKLSKELDLLDVFCIASGAMISSGLFILPGLAYAQAGPCVFLAYLVAAMFALPALFSKAELCTAMPKAGGVYFFIERSMGAAMGTIGGLAAWFSLSLKSAFALVGIGAFATIVFPDLGPIGMKLVAIGCCLVFLGVNLVGVKHAGRLQVYMVAALICILIYYVIRGFPHMESARFAPFIPYGPGAILATAGMVFVSFGGLTKVASVAEEVRNPGRNIPLGMLLAFVVVTLLYVFVIVVTVGVAGGAALGTTLTPLSLGAKAFLGTAGVAAVSGAALLAFITTANAGILAASRDPMAMSRDGLLPEFFGKVHPRFQTPHGSLIFTAAFMIAAILFLDLEGLVKVASTLKIVLFMFANISVILMRESKIQNYRPKFRSPFYPWLQIAGIIGYGFLLFKLGPMPLLLAGGFIAAGLVWYWLYAKEDRGRESALVHVVERIAGRDLDSYSLGGELRDILRERDEITEDRFDLLVRNCEVMDLDHSVSMEEFFGMLGDSFSDRLQVPRDTVIDLLTKREQDTSTALTPQMAIPHLIVEGNGKFDILLIRCRDGIHFSDEAPAVQAVFALAGSPDERNFHLRALMAIAQIAQQKDFESRWQRARSPEALRDLVLLAHRKRHIEA